MSGQNPLLSLLRRTLLYVIVGCMAGNEVYSQAASAHEQLFPIDTTTISAAFPYPSSFVDVYGSQMHYVDVAGPGNRTFLLVHGNPTSSYLWRNVIPHLQRRGRVIAVDLIGMGKSAKPELDYTFSDHLLYFTGFVDALELEDVILVLHDWGGAIGAGYAARHPEQIKGIAFFEAFVVGAGGDSLEAFGPSSGDPSNPSVGDLFRAFRTGVEADTTTGSGWDLTARRNIFIEGFLRNNASMDRRLTDEEMVAYREPFPTEASRKPIWRWPRQIPVAGYTADGSILTATMLQVGSDYMQTSRVPKLLLYATPGAITPENTVAALRQLPNIRVVPFGPGRHYLQEQDPHTIGREIVRWVDQKDL